jgi:hypothetical protein
MMHPEIAVAAACGSPEESSIDGSAVP